MYVQSKNILHGVDAASSIPHENYLVVVINELSSMFVRPVQTLVQPSSLGLVNKTNTKKKPLLYSVD